MSFVVNCERTRIYDVYIGRGPDPRTGRHWGWGNPFRIGRDGDRSGVILKYRMWLLSRPRLAGRVRRELRGKVLGCHCAPLPCHGDVLAAIANEEASNGNAVDPRREQHRQAGHSDYGDG